ncbi:MAG: molybdopterin molybdotransferase MoeA [Casimicrobiaceae bacterium]|nr:molybdopterin molybdotransferase MoeA [Casimicrobiaceae bacterium]MDW8312173.1 molybdopterin molybdotransferase MoeA [Burkholderiales bacterium]
MSALSAFSRDSDYDPSAMSVERARDYIARVLEPLTDFERVPIRSALGRVLARDIVSPIDVPGHDNSGFDGWAFRHADLAHTTLFKPVGKSFAGKPYLSPVGPGECVRIFTGAVMPPGCDTVAPQEKVQETDQGVVIGPDYKPGQNRRLAGEDLKAGAVALARGKLITPSALGLMASLGIAEIDVYRKLRVAFFSTGDELKTIGSPLGPGEIYDSNRYTLWGLITQAGCEPIDLGNFVDTPEAIRAAFERAASCADVIITSGGVSVGEADFIKPMLNELGEVLFWKIAMKPGRPLAYGRIGRAHFFGLPGNPVAVVVTFCQFVRGALAILQGRTDFSLPPTVQATLTNRIKKLPGRTEFQRGVLTRGAGGYEVRTTGDQGSGILSSMTQANCFIVLDAEVGNVEPGTKVEVQMFDGLFS